MAESPLVAVMSHLMSFLEQYSHFQQLQQQVDQYRAEVERLTRELAEANREKIRAAECGLVVLEENQTLKQIYYRFNGI